MREPAEIEARWQASLSQPEPRGRGTVRLICVRKGDGVHECPERVAVSQENGVQGDRWLAVRRAGTQVTLMSARVAALVAGDAVPLHAAGDNFLVDLDLSEAALPVGSRVRLGTVLLEISPDPHAGCKKFRDRFGMNALLWVNDPERAALRLRGVNCRVVASGEVVLGDAIEVLEVLAD